MPSLALKGTSSIRPTAHARSMCLPLIIDIHSSSKTLDLKGFCHPDGGKNLTIISRLSLYNHHLTGSFSKPFDILCLMLDPYKMAGMVFHLGRRNSGPSLKTPLSLWVSSSINFFTLEFGLPLIQFQHPLSGSTRHLTVLVPPALVLLPRATGS